MQFDSPSTPRPPLEYAYCFDFATAISTGDFELRLCSPTGRHIILADEFFSLTRELQDCLVKDVGRVTIFVPEEEDRGTSFRIHFELPFDERPQLSPYSNRDGLQIDRLVDLARLALERIAILTPSAIAERNVDIVVQSLSEMSAIPYWKIGSDIAISCLASSDIGKSFFDSFRIWDPISDAWLDLDMMDALCPIEELFELSQKSTNILTRRDILEKTQYLETQGLIVEQEQWLLAAKIYQLSDNPSIREKARHIELCAYGI